MATAHVDLVRHKGAPEILPEAADGWGGDYPGGAVLVAVQRGCLTVGVVALRVLMVQLKALHDAIQPVAIPANGFAQVIPTSMLQLVGFLSARCDQALPARSISGDVQQQADWQVMAARRSIHCCHRDGLVSSLSPESVGKLAIA